MLIFIIKASVLVTKKAADIAPIVIETRHQSNYLYREINFCSCLWFTNSMEE